MLKQELFEELKSTLSPRYQEAQKSPELAHMRQVALSSLMQYEVSNNRLTGFRQQPIRSNTEAVVNRRNIQALETTIKEELGHLAKFVTDVSHLDSTAIDLSDRLNAAVKAQARVIAS